MSGGYDKYDLHREIDLSKVERIIYIDDAIKANLARSNLLAGALPDIGNKISGAQYEIGTILEKNLEAGTQTLTSQTAQSYGLTDKKYGHFIGNQEKGSQLFARLGGKVYKAWGTV